MIGLASIAVPKAQEDGLASMIPNGILVRLPAPPVPLARELLHQVYTSGALTQEIADRARSGRLSASQQTVLMRRLESSLSSRGLLGSAESNRAMYETLSARVAVLPDSLGVLPLKDAAAAISAAIGIKIELDEPDLAASQILPTTLVNLANMRPGVASSVLDSLAAAIGESNGSLGCAWIVSGDHILLSGTMPKHYLLFPLPADSGTSYLRKGDRAFSYPTTQSWIDLITLTIAPDSWQHNGGIDAHLVPIFGRLLIEAPERTILGVERLAAMLASTESVAGPAVLTALRQRRLELESTQLSIDLPGGITIRKAIAVISAASGVPIRFDESSFDEVVTYKRRVPNDTPDLDQRLYLSNNGTTVSFASILDRVLAGTGLVWGFDSIGKGLVIQSTSADTSPVVSAVYRFPRVTEARMKWALGGQGQPPAPRLNDPPLSVEYIIASIEGAFLTTTWTSSGGEIGHSRVWTRDPPRFVITQIEPVHAKIYALLKKLEAAAAGESSGQQSAEPSADAPAAARASTSPPGTQSGRK